jgi:hypothetical protein
MVPTLERQKVVAAYLAVMSELEERKEALSIKFHMGLLVFLDQPGMRALNHFRTSSF